MTLKMLLCISIVDWVLMITQVTLALTAVIMAHLAYKTFIKTPWQDSVPEDGSNRTLLNEEIIIFDTTSQRTRIVLEHHQIKCYLLDKKKGEEKLQWEIDKKQGEDLLINSNIYVNPFYKANTGTFTIGRRKNWLYSKRLFPDPNYLKNEIILLLEKLKGND